MKYDIFISHADEDSEVTILLANRLKDAGLKVFLDKYNLKAGDSLSLQINRALLESRFAVIIASPAYFEKKWAMRELSAILVRENYDKITILPVLHNLNEEELANLFPILADKLSLSFSDGIDTVAETISRVVASDAAANASDATAIARSRRVLEALSNTRLAKLNRWGPLLRFTQPLSQAFAL